MLFIFQGIVVNERVTPTPERTTPPPEKCMLTMDTSCKSSSTTAITVFRSEHSVSAHYY